jgi:DNA-binding response OmpR family regulator
MDRPLALVVDDDSSIRELVSSLLERIGFEPIAVGTGAEALTASEASEPGLVILDVRMDDMSGYEILRSLRERFGTGMPIMFLTGERTESFDRVGGLLLGADDYMVKPFDPDELVARATALVRRRPPRERGRAVVGSKKTPLTGRELEVLELLALGLDQDEIARRLVISPKTVSTHLQHVLAKFGVHSRAQAVVEAYRRGLTSGGESDVAQPAEYLSTAAHAPRGG